MYKKEGTISLKAGVDQIKPHMYAENKSPDLTNREYASALYRQFNVRPYWDRSSGQGVYGYHE